MGRLLQLKPKVLASVSIQKALLFLVLLFSLTVVMPVANVAAFGEQYEWKDSETIDGHDGSLGNFSHFFTKSSGIYYGGNGKVVDMYILSEPATTPDNCIVMLGIQVGADKGSGTLRRVVDPILDLASNSCPQDYVLSKSFNTNLRIANADKSGSAPSTKVTVTVRALVPEDEDYPGTSDTFTIQDTAGKVLAKRSVTKDNAYSRDGWKGFERKFTLTTSVGSDKTYEACSAALSQCARMTGLSLLSAPLGIYEIEIKREPTNTGVVCSAGALGWVLCPLSEAIVGATEGIAGLLENLLVFQPLTNSEQGTAIKSIWSSLLGIANAGLAVAFLVVIFSQATSIGLSSYGIKKLLPRVIAAAILMNLSFYICAAAVDISNILGVSVKSIVDSGISIVNRNSTNPDVYTGASGMQWIGVSATALFAAAIAFATGAIFLLLPIIVSGVMAAFTALIVIAARQVLITLLIIIAPLAILAWILPNTEQWFTKWRKLFTLLLLMFPMVMAIFYGSVLVSSVILVSGTNSGNGLNDFTIKLLAFLVLVVPLFSLPFVIKSVGGIMDRLGVIVNNRNKGVVDRSRNWAKGQSQRTRENNMARMSAADWGSNPSSRFRRTKRGLAKGANFAGGYTARRDFKRSSLKSDADRIQQNAIADQLQAADSRLAARSTLRGDTGQAIARARGVAIQDKAIGEEVSAAKTVIENMQFTNAQLAQLATTGSAQNISGQSLSGDFYQKAAQQQFVSTGQTAKVHDMLKNSQGMSEEVRGSLAYYLQQNYSTLKAKDHSLNDDRLKEALINGTQIGDTELQIAAVDNMSGLTKEVLAGQDAKGVAQLKLAVRGSVGDPTKRAKAVQVVTEMMSDPHLSGRLSADSEREFNEILAIARGGNTPPPTTPPNANPGQPPTSGP